MYHIRLIWSSFSNLTHFSVDVMSASDEDPDEDAVDVANEPRDLSGNFVYFFNQHIEITKEEFETHIHFTFLTLRIHAIRL